MATSEPDPPAHHGSLGRATGVWPVLGVLVVLVGLGVLLLPSVRAQAELSFTRTSPEFLELSAAAIDPEHVGTTCALSGTPAAVTVAFTVGSHLGDEARVEYDVQVSTATAPYGEPLRERVRLQPGASKTRTVVMPVPRTPRFVVDVRLPASGEYLKLHCGGPA